MAKIFSGTVLIAVFLIVSLASAFASEENYDDLFNELKERSLYISEDQLLDIKACFLINNGLSKESLVNECIAVYDKYARYEETVEKTSRGVGSSKIQGVGFIRINSFSVAPDMTFTEIIPVLQEFQKEGINLLVIDLRGNEGGFLRPTIDFLNQFAPEKGRSIVELRGRVGEMMESTMYVAWNKGRCADWKVAVLVDRETASAAEIAAGVLQTWGAKV